MSISREIVRFNASSVRRIASILLMEYMATWRQQGRGHAVARNSIARGLDCRDLIETGKKPRCESGLQLQQIFLLPLRLAVDAANELS